jgi:hypothetical protein
MIPWVGKLAHQNARQPTNQPNYLVSAAESFIKNIIIIIIIIIIKTIIPQLVNKFPAFYTTRRFIAVFITARHLSPSSASSTRPPGLCL